jgi:hypothetical protein
MTNQTISVTSGSRRSGGFNSRSIEWASGARNSSSRSAAMLLGILAVGCLPGLASASMRCGSKVIDKGTSSAVVTSFCGAATQVDRVTGIGADVQIEVWTYNFGPNRLMQRLRIEDGIVVDVQSLGYGFNSP